MDFRLFKCSCCQHESNEPNEIGHKYVCECGRVLQIDEFRDAVVIQEKVRDPVIGEKMRCGVCGGDCRPVDAKFIDYWDNVVSKHRELYDIYLDSFLSYDGCEEHFEY